MVSNNSDTSAFDSRDSRRARARDIAFRVHQKRLGGLQISDSRILNAHPDLQRELQIELRKVHHISAAMQCAERDDFERLLDNLRSDLEIDESSSDETESLVPQSPSSPSTDSDYNFDVVPPRVDPQKLPRTFGRYQLKEQLGEGGFGQVYLAWDQQLQRDVAIKVPHRFNSVAGGMEGFLSEARIAAQLDHPNILPVYDAGATAEGEYYVVTKLITGQDLCSRIKKHRLPVDDVIRIAAAVADALGHAHQFGLVHRDVKPANILLDTNDTPYVADFGLALRLEDQAERISHAGTPAYMSPEQAQGEVHRVDPRSDVFSLGVVLYELLTSHKPFQGNTHTELLDEILWKAPAPPSSLNRSVPAALDRICLKALSKRAGERFRDAAELRDDLLSLASQANGSPSGDRKPEDNIVPKGLRPFESQDADYFLKLLPGPYDREGLPSCIRQWKQLYESEPNYQSPMGVIYGPSGCGKSSLVRAGLLPELAANIATVFLDATPDETEKRLLNQLHKRLPDLPTDLDLPETISTIRRGEALPQDKRVLIVIDQFEQWLHGKGETERRPLVRALRQCDGDRVQVLFLVRDDFWLAQNRFLRELEVELIEGRNVALVDLFDLQHARKVLFEFGRAFGRLPDTIGELQLEQAQFLDAAISDLSEEDRVICVRLAIFAEMVKSRPWTLETLRRLKGADGVGANFLDNTFCSGTAPARYRAHKQAALAVLEALLPHSELDIREQTCSHADLLEISGYGMQLHSFGELVQILDLETRLITPVDFAGNRTESDSLPPSERYYQLSHDFLIPAIRELLSRQQRSTVSGRAEHRLIERSRFWNTKREGRQLPSLFEWGSIQLLTRRSQWTAAQRRMMRAATRRHELSITTALGLLVSFVFAGPEVTTLSRNVVAHIQARTASIWLSLGQEESIWKLLTLSENPTIRTDVIHGLSPLVIDPEEMLEDVSEQDDLSRRRAMVMIVGAILGEPGERLSTPASLRLERAEDDLLPRLIRWYRQDPDPGMHSAVEWTLAQYRQREALTQADIVLKKEQHDGRRRWYLNREDHTMMIMPGPSQFRMGSPDSPNRSDEHLHDRQIARSFAIASKEVTVEQFSRFLAEQRWSHFPTTPPNRPLTPQTSITWYEAAAYCNWLSKREGIPAPDWCYLPNADGEYAPGMQLAPNCEELAGYRLPTEEEWEFACRAGTSTKYYFGTNPRRLGKYAICGVLNGRLGQVATKMPNDNGLFDMYGNAAEWCHNWYRPYPIGPTVPRASSLEERTIQDGEPRVVRGGSSGEGSEQTRSAYRHKLPPSTRNREIGFRVARNHL